MERDSHKAQIPEDKSGLEHDTYESIDLKPQIDELNAEILGKLGEIFIDPTLKSRTFEKPQLDWQIHTPNIYRDYEHFQTGTLRELALTKGEQRIQLDMKFGGRGLITLFYGLNGNFSRIERTTIVNGVRDNNVQDSVNPMAQIVYLERIAEGFDFFKAEQENRMRDVNVFQEDQ